MLSNCSMIVNPQDHFFMIPVSGILTPMMLPPPPDLTPLETDASGLWDVTKV